MSDAVFQGYSRFYHIEKLRKDEAYKSIHGGDAPSEKVCRDTLALLPDDAADTFRIINKDLLAMQAKSEGVREVAADFDDSVITVFGNQELPKEWLLKRVRADRGFFDDDNFTYFEDQGYEYIIKAKMTLNMHKVVKWVCEHPDDYRWEQEDERKEEHAVFHTTDIRLPMPGWAKSRRIVIVRKTLPPRQRMVSLCLMNAGMNIRQS